MALSQEQLTQALNKIGSIGPKPCPYCGLLKGFVFDKNGTDIITNGGINISNGYIDCIPAITGFCKNSSYVVPFSLKGLNVI